VKQNKNKIHEKRETKKRKKKKNLPAWSMAIFIQLTMCMTEIKGKDLFPTKPIHGTT